MRLVGKRLQSYAQRWSLLYSYDVSAVYPSSRHHSTLIAVHRLPTALSLRSRHDIDGLSFSSHHETSCHPTCENPTLLDVIRPPQVPRSPAAVSYILIKDLSRTNVPSPVREDEQSNHDPIHETPQAVTVDDPMIICLVSLVHPTGRTKRRISELRELRYANRPKTAFGYPPNSGSGTNSERCYQIHDPRSLFPFDLRSPHGLGHGSEGFLIAQFSLMNCSCTEGLGEPSKARPLSLTTFHASEPRRTQSGPVKLKVEPPESGRPHLHALRLPLLSLLACWGCGFHA